MIGRRPPGSEQARSSPATRRRVRIVLLAVAALALVFPLGDLIGGTPVIPTDYDRELGRIDDALAGRPGATLTGPGSLTSTRIAYLRYRRATATGRLEDLRAAEQAIGAAFDADGASDDLFLLKANLDFRSHRLAATKAGLERLSGRTDRVQVRLLAADVALHEDRHDEARAGYTAAIEKTRTWDGLARLAYLEARTGSPAAADQLYAEAQEELTAKEMGAYAWLELQRGLLHLRHGRHDQAMAHYRQARRAYSGNWVVDEHIAELLGAQGKFDEAALLYEQVIARAPRPQLQHALGDLYARMGHLDRAAAWHAEALRAYLDSAARGEVHYYHHLAMFYADVREDGAEAVRWARRDLALRPNAATQEMLAWALYRDRRITDALDAIARALGAGVVDAHLFFHAGMISLAAGRIADGTGLLRRAAEVNPRYKSFHVHR
jgi:tetratricopeptide (TPR) repeat protein